MSTVEKVKLWIGKIKNIPTQYGVMQKIYLDSLKATKEDGTPDTYFKGTLIFVLPDGAAFQVKQLGIENPKNGMNPNLAQKGYVSHITLTLGDPYSTEPL